jgi:hypothetical protein
VDDGHASPYYVLAKLIYLEGKQNKIESTKALIKISYLVTNKACENLMLITLVYVVSF